MKKKPVLPAEHEEETRVVLKPIFGIPPRTYVAAGYALFLLGALFFLLLYQGIVKPGAELSVRTLPEGASVYLDGVRVGFSPLVTYAAKGKRTLTVKKAHFTTKELTLDIPGRLFGSLFLPKKETALVILDLESPKGLLDGAHEEFAAWTMTGEPNPNYQFPPVLGDAAADYALAAKTDIRELWNMLHSSARHVNSPGAFKDFVRGSLLAGSEGTALSPQGLVRSIVFLSRLVGSHELLPYWLATVLPESAAEAFASSPFATAEMESLSARMKTELKQPRTSGQTPRLLRLGGREFALIPAGRFYQGWAGISDAAPPRDTLSPPHPVSVLPFYLQTTETTEEEFAEFLKENPRWEPANRELLVREGLAEASYLASWRDSAVPTAPAYPVREVSFFAAAAYCEWLGKKYPDYVFSLPTEAQWEWAASLDMPSPGRTSPVSRTIRPAAEGIGGNAGLKFMEGNVWEWCADWYAPVSYIFSDIQETFPGVERVVRGGSWINSEGAVTVSTRGAQPPAWSTPYLGFRPSAVLKKDVR